MKYLRRRAEKSSKPASPGMFKRGLSRLKLGIITCAVATSMAFAMPMTEARANPPTGTTEAKQLFSVKGVKTTLSYKGNKHTVYGMGSTNKPVVSLQGPAEITVRVYPAVLQKTFAKTPEFVHSIECSSGPVGKTQTTNHYSGKTKDSKIQHSMVVSPIAIGTPIQITTKVAAGAQQFSVTSPNGFMEIVSVKPIKVAVRKRPRKSPRIVLDVGPPKKVKKPAKKKPAKRTLFTTDAARIHIDGLGPNANKGDLNGTTMLGHIPVSRSVSLLIGVNVNSFGLAFDIPEASTSIRSLSTNLAFGVSYERGKHLLTALALGGYRHMWSRVSPLNSAVVKDESSEGEGGGAISYAYDKYLVLSVLGKNDHFNPIAARVYGALPWGLPWVKDGLPSLDVTYSWLRPAISSDEEGYVGGAKMSHNAHDLLMVADLPFLRLKMFTLSVTGGAEMTMSNGADVWYTGLAGGTLTFDYNGVAIQFRGYSSFQGQPFMFLNVSYSN